MTMVRRLLLISSFVFLPAFLVGALAPHCAAQAAPSATSQPAQAAASQSPQQQAYTLPPDKLAKAIALSRIRNILDFAGSLWGIAFLWLLLETRCAAVLDAWTARILRRRWLQGLLFFAILLILVTLSSLPLEWYGQHVSRAYGISVQSWGSWLTDQAKGLGLSLAIGVPILMLFHRIVRRWPRRFWLGAWAVAVPLMVLGTFVSPLLEPIFNKYEPLSLHHPTLVADLEKVVARTGTDIPPDRMYLMKASLKTNGLNAYVSGLGATKRVVVWDTTAGRVPNDEILFIFAHESGHYVLNHIPKMLAGSAVFLFFLFWACAGFARWMATRFGTRWHLGEQGITSRAGFIVLILAITIAGFITQPIGNAFSRHFEHQADVYGQEAIHGIVPDPQKTAVAAFDRLGEVWLEDPNPSPFIEFWLYNHPSVQSRANFALHYNPWANGGHGQFFKN